MAERIDYKTYGVIQQHEYESLMGQKHWRNQATGWIQAMHEYSIWGKNATFAFPRFTR